MGVRSTHRYLKVARSAVAGAVIAGVVAVAGCGGGESKKTATPVAPVTPTGSSSGAVAATGSGGLVGPAERTTKARSQATDKATRIAANANRVPRGRRGGPVAGAEACNGDMMPDGSNTAAVNQAILCLLNAIRSDQGLSTLSESPQLDQAAQLMGDLMVQDQFFSHVTPDGRNVVDRIQPTGYLPRSGDWVVGENLAWGNGTLATPNAIVNGWMNSPGHKANILAPDYKDIGLAAVQGSPTPQGSGGTTYVNDFGAKSGADPNITLPPEGGSNAGASTASTGAKKAHASSKKSKHKKKKKKRHHRKHRRH